MASLLLMISGAAPLKRMASLSATSAWQELHDQRLVTAFKRGLQSTMCHHSSWLNKAEQYAAIMTTLGIS